MTITAKLADLRWALTATLPHAGKDHFLPSLQGVTITAGEGDDRLTVSATDRYTFVRSSILLTDPAPTAVQAFISPDTVAAVLRSHKPTAKEATSAQVDIAGDEKEVAFLTDTGRTVGRNEWAITPPTAATTSFDAAINGYPEPGSFGEALFNVSYLAKFEKAKVRGADSLLITFGPKPDRPVRVQIGDEDGNILRGLIMTVRRPG